MGIVSRGMVLLLNDPILDCCKRTLIVAAVSELSEKMPRLNTSEDVYSKLLPTVPRGDIARTRYKRIVRKSGLKLYEAQRSVVRDALITFLQKFYGDEYEANEERLMKQERFRTPKDLLVLAPRRAGKSVITGFSIVLFILSMPVRCVVSLFAQNSRATELLLELVKRIIESLPREFTGNIPRGSAEKLTITIGGSVRQVIAYPGTVTVSCCVIPWNVPTPGHPCSIC